MLFLILAMALSGLIIGGLGRLVVPGPNPMSIFHTILFGLAGSFLGGLVGRLAFGWRYRYSYVLAFVLAVALTGLLIAWSSRRSLGSGRRNPL